MKILRYTALVSCLSICMPVLAENQYLQQQLEPILIGESHSIEGQQIHSPEMTVANNTPNARDTAIGITIFACKLVSIMIGKTPIKVVIEVSNIALKRRAPACITASLIATPSARALLTKSTITSESFTTTPATAIIPNTDKLLIVIPKII